LQINTIGGTKTETFTVTKRDSAGRIVSSETVTEKVSGGPVTGATVTFDAGEIRRLRRVLDGHAGSAPVYHGTLTDGFVSELRKALGA
jgi:hypothetical protein